jgi:2,4-dienoyl-CoA reductase-like NADH-dependent reductase (Old Yellow Enzyme family)
MIRQRSITDQIPLPCGRVLANRIAKAAMSEQLADERGDVTPALLALYRAWANAGAGLLITGNATVDRAHPIEPFNVVVDDRADRDGLARWAATAKGGGAAVWLQLNHPGRQVLRTVASTAPAPSVRRRHGVELGLARPYEMTDADIRRVIEAFRVAAVIADDVGFDGVEIHAAHGYLASQFLSPNTNRRTDEWGGSLEHRMRFLLRVVEAVRTSVRPSFAVAVKLNASDLEPGGLTTDEGAAVVAALTETGIDLIEITAGSASAWLDVFAGCYDDRDAYFADAIEELPRSASAPLMLTGGIRSAAAMTRLLARGVDVVGLARPFAVDPRVAARLLDGHDLSPLPRHPRTWPKPLGALLHSPWYQHQLERIARDESVDARFGRIDTARRHAATLRAWRRASPHSKREVSK